MKRITTIVLFLFLGMQLAFAQGKVITGTVTSATDGSTIPGVQVVIKGTTTGVTTDMNGAYSLIVPQLATVLEFSFIGLVKKEVTINNQTTIDVVMEEDLFLLNEVIVVGYGTATKQSFTGSVKTIKSENLKNKSISNISQSLAGEAAGVTVINTNGQPGSSATIRIRGLGSVNGNRSPLYVLDGIPFDGALNLINPNDIETTTILKDATATAIYGSRGANGVILLTTKSGKAGTSVIEVEVKTGVNVSGLPRNSIITSPEQYIGLTWEGLYNKGVAQGNPDPNAYANDNLFSGGGLDPKYNLWNVTGADLIDPATRTVRDGVTRRYTPERWEDYGFQSSDRTEVNLIMRGGTDKSKYFSSFGYLNDVGYVINSDFKRYNATVSLDQKVKPWLNAFVRMSFSGNETNNNGQGSSSNSIFWFVDNIPPIFPLFLRDVDGNTIPEPIYGGNEYDYGIGRDFATGTNSIAGAHYNRQRRNSNQLTGSTGWTINLSKNLTFETSLGTQYYTSIYNRLDNPFFGTAAGEGGYVYKTNTNLFVYHFLNIVRYKNSFGNHNIRALAGHESNSWQREYRHAAKSTMVHPDIDDFNNFVNVASPPGSYTENVKTESYLSQVNYNFDNTYYFTASVRADGTSRFIENNKWDVFGSLGFSWMLSKETFMQNLSFIDFLKYKISYGITGDQGDDYYPALNTYNISNLNDQISISADQIGNPDLTWEKSKMFQTGIEFSLGKYVDGVIDYYIKNTNNLLFERRVGPSVGYALLQVNDGILRNSAIEFDFTVHLIKEADYSLDFTINGDMPTNKLIHMPIDPATGEEKIIDINGSWGRGVGHSLYDFYITEWAGVDPADGTAMWNQYYFDENENGALDPSEGILSLFDYTTKNPDNAISKTTTKTYADATQKYIGKSAIPKVRGAFRLQGTYKNIDVAAQFIYSLGGYAYDGGYAVLMDNDSPGNGNWSTDILNRWQNPGDITDVPRLSSGFDVNGNSASTRFITNTDFLALNNLRIGYTFSDRVTAKLGLSSLSIYVSGDNLFLLSARDGFNPSTSVSGSSDMYRYTPLTTYTFGLRVKI